MKILLCFVTDEKVVQIRKPGMLLFVFILFSLSYACKKCISLLTFRILKNVSHYIYEIFIFPSSLVVFSPIHKLEDASVY